MNNPLESPYKRPDSKLEQNGKNLSFEDYRRTLVPTWMKVFGWIVIVLCLLAIFNSAYSLLTRTNVDNHVLGLVLGGNIMNPLIAIDLLILISMATSAYGLLFGKSWGLRMSKIVTTVVLVKIVTIMVLRLIYTGSGNIRLELFIASFYLYMLFNIGELWNQRPGKSNGVSSK